MQFHVEVDEEKLRRWSMLDSAAYRSLQQRHATVHSGAAMREAMAEHLPVQQALADRVYARWLAGVMAAPAERLSYRAQRMPHRGMMPRCTAA